MNEYGVEVAELHKTASLLLHRRHRPLYNGLDFFVETEILQGDTV
jgi:hypothetical protein